MKVKDLSPLGIHLVESKDTEIENHLKEWRYLSGKPHSSPKYLVGSYGKAAMKAESMMQWMKAVHYHLGPKGDGLDTCLDELNDRLDTWTPTESTCLLQRETGTCKLKGLREVRDFVKMLIKIGGHQVTPEITE